MSDKKDFEEVSNNAETNTHNTENEESQTSLERKDIKIEFDNNKEDKVAEHNKSQKSTEEENVFVVTPYTSDPGSHGQTFGNRTQHVYYERGNTNPGQQPPPFPPQQPPLYPNQQQPPYPNQQPPPYPNRQPSYPNQILPPHPNQEQSPYPIQQQIPYQYQQQPPYQNQQQPPYSSQLQIPYQFQQQQLPYQYQERPSQQYQQQPPKQQIPEPFQLTNQDEDPRRRVEPSSENIVYNPETRNRFIRLVMVIVLIMLLATALFIAVVLAVPAITKFFNTNRTFIIFVTLVWILIVHYAITCFVPFTRHPPGNIITLILSVIGMSFFCGVVTSYFDTHIVLYAFLATAVVVIICIVLAFTRFDFTSYMLYVIVMVTTFIVMAAVIMTGLFILHIDIKPTFVAFLILATLLQVIIFTIHLQTIIGGKRVYLREKDYALGAYMLYMSIIDIFVKMVCTIGISSEL